MSRGSPKITSMHIGASLITQIVTLCIAGLIIQFMHKLADVPECKKIEPYTREGLLAYSYFLAIMSGMASLILIFFLLSEKMN